MEHKCEKTLIDKRTIEDLFMKMHWGRVFKSGEKLYEPVILKFLML